MRGRPFVSQLNPNAAFLEDASTLTPSPRNRILCAEYILLSILIRWYQKGTLEWPPGVAFEELRRSRAQCHRNYPDPLR